MYVAEQEDDDRRYAPRRRRNEEVPGGGREDARVEVARGEAVGVLRGRLPQALRTYAASFAAAVPVNRAMLHARDRCGADPAAWCHPTAAAPCYAKCVERFVAHVADSLAHDSAHVMRVRVVCRVGDAAMEFVMADGFMQSRRRWLQTLTASVDGEELDAGAIRDPTLADIREYVRAAIRGRVKLSEHTSLDILLVEREPARMRV